jgi:hypothetical protein
MFERKVSDLHMHLIGCLGIITKVKIKFLHH